MNWSRLALHLPTLIGTAINIAERFKDKSGVDKEAAVIAGIKDGFELVEEVSEKDLINDPALDELISAYIKARVALMNFVTKKRLTTP